MSGSPASPRSARFSSSCVVAAVVLAALGCSRPASPPAAQANPGAPPAPTAPGAAAPANPVAAAAPAAPHGGGAGEKALSADGATVTTPTFRFDLPAAWRREQPSSGMRLAQAVVPGRGRSRRARGLPLRGRAGRRRRVELRALARAGRAGPRQRPGARRFCCGGIQDLLDRRPRHPAALHHGQRSGDAAARLPAPGRGRRSRGRSVVLQGDRPRVDARRRT